MSANDKPWSLVHYACVKSAVERIRPTYVFFYCEYEPSGPWWNLTRRMVNLVKIKAPSEIFGNPILHPAHCADVVRLEKLLSSGGIYLDVDVFVHRSFDDLLTHNTVLGQQRVGRGVLGLCNAVILAEAQSPFLKRWQSEYRSFRSKGHDEFWDEHAVRVPYRLAKQFPHEITILSESAFFEATFEPTDLSRIYSSREPIDLSRAYATHLWETLAWERHLEHLTPRRVRKVDTNFHCWVRPIIEDLPDAYGRPRGADRMARSLRRLKQEIKSIYGAIGIRIKPNK
jgi:hypothetical protein